MSPCNRGCKAGHLGKKCEAGANSVSTDTEYLHRNEAQLMNAVLRSLPIGYGGNVLERRQRSAAEFLAWADHHAQEQRLSQSSHVQLEGHPDLLDSNNALAQQRVWANRQAHQKHIHDSAMAHLRHGCV